MSKILHKESLVYRVPLALNEKQRLYIEALGLSGDMTNDAYLNLLSSLSGAKSMDDLNVSTPFLYAWNIIDSGYRFIGLLAEITIEHPEFPEGKEEMDNLNSVIKEFRDTFQHIEPRLSRTLNAKIPILGILKWIELESNLEICWSNTLVPGCIRSGSYEIHNPAGKNISVGISHPVLVSIDRNGKRIEIDFDDLIMFVRKQLKSVNDQLSKQIPNDLELPGVDALMRIQMQFGDTQITDS